MYTMYINKSLLQNGCKADLVCDSVDNQRLCALVAVASFRQLTRYGNRALHHTPQPRRLSVLR